MLYRFRDLIDQHLDELTLSVRTGNGKVWDEAQGDVPKAREAVEPACGIPSLMMGESLMDSSSGFDAVLYREPLGVSVGIAPFDFPAMIPMGWMMSLCIATGNTLVLKAASMTPMTSIRMLELLYEAGLPKGVVNLVTCGRRETELLLTHPDVRGITFVGSTAIGLHVYSTAAAHGKRVQALREAKNHALVLQDAPLELTAAWPASTWASRCRSACFHSQVTSARSSAIFTHWARTASASSPSRSASPQPGSTKRS